MPIVKGVKSGFNIQKDNFNFNLQCQGFLASVPSLPTQIASLLVLQQQKTKQTKIAVFFFVCLICPLINQ